VDKRTLPTACAWMAGMALACSISFRASAVPTARTTGHKPVAQGTRGIHPGTVGGAAKHKGGIGGPAPHGKASLLL
jgi:hypothetical protein